MLKHFATGSFLFFMMIEIAVNVMDALSQVAHLEGRAVVFMQVCPKPKCTHYSKSSASF